MVNTIREDTCLPRRKQAENKRWEPLITRSDDVYIVGTNL